MLINKRTLYVLFVCLISLNIQAQDVLKVSVAANFKPTLKKIGLLFEDKTGIKVTVISGSSGKLFAQISNGAPYDVFLSADSKRPQLLEEQGIGIKNTRFTYAIGQLVLWSPKQGVVSQNKPYLNSKSLLHFAIANPKFAPYGIEAKRILLKLDLYERIKPNLVFGENINQTYQFIRLGHADAGFIAKSQWLALNSNDKGFIWQPLSQNQHILTQQAIALNSTNKTQLFMQFLKSPDIQMLIKKNGYAVEKR